MKALGIAEQRELPRFVSQQIHYTLQARKYELVPASIDLGAADLELTVQERTRLDEVCRPPLLYPYWHQAKTAADRLGPAELALLGPYLAG